MRYAIYYCPVVDTPLGQLGHDWLAASIDGAAIGLDIDRQRRDVLLGDVRRYGWHATIHAPFSLADHRTYDQLRRAVTEVAQTMVAFPLSLKLDRLADFLVLRPTVDGAAERALATACMDALQGLRAPVSGAAWQRRAAGLDATELALLQAHGYPYVLDRYRFHMTLSAPATALEEQAMSEWLEPRVAALPPTMIDALSICREATPGSTFEWIERIALHLPAASERTP